VAANKASAGRMLLLADRRLDVVGIRSGLSLLYPFDR
jgi:hypothetical protein